MSKKKRVTRVAPASAAPLTEIPSETSSAAPRDTSSDSAVASGVAPDISPPSARGATVPPLSELSPAQRRRVARLNQRRSRVLVQDVDFTELDPADAAIPFERVPYVPGDLRRVAIIATLMIALIIVAAFVVPHLVGS